MRAEAINFTEADHQAAVLGATSKEWAGLRAQAGDVSAGAQVAGATPEQAHLVAVSVLLDPAKRALIGQAGGLLLGSQGFRTMDAEIDRTNNG